MYKAINCATLIDGSGDAPIEDAVLLIKGEFIEAVGPKQSV